MSIGGGIPLLERGEELEALRLHLRELAARGGVALITGAGGIGKTRLLGAARAEAADAGMTVLSARCSALERDFAFGVARQVLEPVMHEPTARAALRGAAAAAAPVFDEAEPEGAGHPPTRARLDALHRLTLAVTARRPAVLLVDDLQWCDEPSLRWLAYASRRLAGTRLGLLASLSRGSGPDEARIEQELADDPAALVLTPRPLSERAVGDLIAHGLRRMPEPGFVRACHELSAGNPLVLAELIRDLAAAALEPADDRLGRLHELSRLSVARSMLQRLERLPSPVTALAGAIAVLADDDEADLRLAAELAGLEPATARRAAVQLREAGILAAADKPAFAHPVIAEAVHGGLSAADRAAQHARAARRLAAAGADPERIGGHLLAAEPGTDDAEWVVHTLRAAADDSLDGGRPAVAAAMLRRALEEPFGPSHRAALLAELGRAEARAGDGAAVAHLRAAVDATPDASVRLHLALDLGRALVIAGRPGEAARRIQDALARDGEAGTPALRLRLEAELAGAARLAGEPRRHGVERLRASVRDLPREEPAARLLLASSAFDAALSAGRPAETAATLAEVAWAGGRLLADEGPVAPVVMWVAATLTLAERDSAAAGVLDRLVDEARRQGATVALALAGVLRAELHLRRGELDEAEQAARGALAAQDHSAPAVAALARVQLDRGDLEAAEALLDGAGPDAPGAGGPAAAPVLLARGLLRAAQGRHEQAAEDLLRCGSGPAARAVPNPAALPWRSLAATQLVLAGDEPRARELVTEELALARAFGAPRALGIALRAAGLVAHGADAVGRLDEAAATLDLAAAPLEQARTLLELGAAVRRDGRPAQARAHLVRAQELAERCGAWGVVSRARQELVNAGARPRRPRVSGVEGLTAGERRAAELAAGGRSNREIAQALYLTPKTIEMHLSSAYRKLDIRSRAELTDALGLG
jgi:DNA-binding CsgD family transcriptional regulator/Tfp pilus assembly protein PilF